MQAMSSLLRNPHLSMEPYIQQLMPAIMTCIVRRQLGVRPTFIAPPQHMLSSQLGMLAKQGSTVPYACILSAMILTKHCLNPSSDSQ